MTSDPSHLFDHVANPLNDIKASINNSMEKYSEIQPAATNQTDSNPLKRLNKKFELVRENMIK
jgi:hypothetical protein